MRIPTRPGRASRQLFLALLFLALPGCGGKKVQPNILLITVDTLRADHLSAWGYPRKTSPVIDQMASEGVRFASAQVQWPKTGPSFASIMTATYPKDNGIVRRVGIPIPCAFRTLAEELKRLGYQTHAVVSNGALGREFFYDQGFDDYGEAWKGASTEAEIEEATRAGHVTDLALASLARAKADRPIFLWVHYLDPHFPYRPPADWKDKFQGDGALPKAPPMVVDYKHERRVTGAIGRSQVLDGREDLDFYLARYDAEIAYADHEIGRLVDAYRQRGIYDRTVTAFTSDHGESLGEHGYYFDHGMLPFQDCLHVPLIVRYPQEYSPRIDQDPVEVMNVAPTLLELAGMKAPEKRWAQGRSMTRRLDGRESGRGTVAFSEAGYAQDRKWMRVAFDGRFKYVWAPTTPDQRMLVAKGLSQALYDLEADPGETTDVSQRFPGDYERLGRLLSRWWGAPQFLVDRDPADCGGSRAVDKSTEEQMRALGYL